jgi:DNA-binding IclR family transcriptional regulator
MNKPGPGIAHARNTKANTTVAGDGHRRGSADTRRDGQEGRAPVAELEPGGSAAETAGIRAVHRAIRCLRFLTGRFDPAPLSEIAEHLGLAPSSAHRLLATLQSEGLVEQDPRSHRYLVSAAIIELAMRPLLEEDRLRNIARPILEELRERTGETVHLATLRGANVVTVEQLESMQTLLVRHPKGMILPAHATAVGKALVAFRPEIVAALVAEGLRQLTPFTVTDPALFEAELDSVRRTGYAINERQRLPDTAGVAAPVFGAASSPVAAIGISGPASRVQGDVLPALAEQARSAAEQLTRLLRTRSR